MAQLTILHDDEVGFPPVSQALTDPNGLLAIGGTLGTARLINAYEQGIFPWYNEDEPVMWWSPDPRCVIYTDQFSVNRSFARFLKKRQFKITLNHAFDQVIEQCAQPRPYQQETWIGDDIIKSYQNLHQAGIAHSVEVWLDDQLVGGVYGIFVGHTFCGESMFSRVTNGSKTALYTLCQWLNKHQVTMVDCQVPNPHLMSLGAQEISRQQFISHLNCVTLRQRQTNIDWQPQELSYE